MEGIMTIRDLIQELTHFEDGTERNLDEPVMIAVIKYPEEFKLQFRDGEPRWTDHDDVELIPLGFDDIISFDGVCHIAAELEEFNKERWMVGGNSTD